MNEIIYEIDVTNANEKISCKDLLGSKIEGFEYSKRNQRIIFDNTISGVVIDKVNFKAKVPVRINSNTINTEKKLVDFYVCVNFNDIESSTTISSTTENSLEVFYIPCKYLTKIHNLLINDKTTTIIKDSQDEFENANVNSKLIGSVVSGYMYNNKNEKVITTEDGLIENSLILDKFKFNNSDYYTCIDLDEFVFSSSDYSSTITSIKQIEDFTVFFIPVEYITNIVQLVFESY